MRSPLRFARIPPAAAVLLAVVGLVSPGGAQPDRPPVELYSPPPTYPPEAAGSDVDPEVTVEVTIDARGRVKTVEVRKIVPSSPWNELFADAFERTLREWRYAPRFENGEPVAARLQWTATFLHGARSAGRPTASDWVEQLLPLPAVRGSSRSPLTLPHEQRVRLLERSVATGVEVLGDETITESSPRFVVRTNADAETARAISQNLEATYGFLDRLFAERIPPQPESLKLQTFVFAERIDLDDFRYRIEVSEVLGAGFYSQLGLIALHLQVSTPADARELILHEATHAYMDRRIVRPDVRLPYWLDEGFAEYVANSRVDKGRLVPGRPNRGRHVWVRFDQGELRITKAETKAAASLDEVRRAVKRRTALRLGDMLDADRTEFYGEQRRLYYGMSWLLVHFLRHGEDDWGEDAFPRFLLYAGEGYPVSASLATAYGATAAELEGAFHRHLMDL